MSRDTTVAAAQYWGYLIKPDKTPSPIFEQLLLGVANYINKHIAPWDTNCLTPTKLATFYRLVGGDYDPLFLDTSQASLSFIYQSLGCYHTLQPEKDPYNPPTVPALTPQGFVRWQTVQLLLEPDEHVPFLQEAVKRFELTNPTDGEPFPSILPREALPTKPDLQMTEWHDTVSEKLMLEAQASQMRNMPPRPQMALSDADPTERSRPSSGDTHSVGDSTIETSSLMGAASYFSRPHTYQNGPPHQSTHPYVKGPARARGFYPQASHPPPSYDAPWSPLRRRSSIPPDNRPKYHHPSSWPRGQPTSPYNQSKFAPPSQQNRPKPHARTPSTLSESSFTSDSSYTTSSASLSPALRSAQLHTTAQIQGADIRRSNSMGYFHPPPGNNHAVHPNAHHTSHVQFPQQRRPSFGANAPANRGSWNGDKASNGSSRPNDRGLNVRWPDQETSRVNRSGTVRGPDRQIRNARSADGRQGEMEKERERRGQSVGVRGRRYA